MIRSTAGALVLVACAAGCAAAAKTGAPAGAPPEPPAPTSIEEAEAQLARAHAQLGGAPSGGLEEATGTTVVSGGAGEAGERKAGHQETEGPCAVACRAIDSMKRAVDAICRIAGAGDSRCVEARKTLADDGTKVARCSCP